MNLVSVVKLAGIVLGGATVAAGAAYAYKRNKELKKEKATSQVVKEESKFDKAQRIIDRVGMSLLGAAAVGAAIFVGTKVPKYGLKVALKVFIKPALHGALQFITPFTLMYAAATGANLAAEISDELAYSETDIEYQELDKGERFRYVMEGRWPKVARVAISGILGFGSYAFVVTRLRNTVKMLSANIETLYQKLAHEKEGKIVDKLPEEDKTENEAPKNPFGEHKYVLPFFESDEWAKDDNEYNEQFLKNAIDEVVRRAYMDGKMYSCTLKEIFGFFPESFDKATGYFGVPNVEYQLVNGQYYIVCDYPVMLPYR